MTLSKREHPAASDELREVANWYDAEELGLGDDLVDAIDETLRYLLDWPLAAPVLPGWEGAPPVRSRRVRVFPYRVLYYVTDTSIVVLAYAHQRRRPEYWQHRLHG